DGSGVSAGDLVQARRNDPTIPLRLPESGRRAGGSHVTNRETYTVLDRAADGGVLVARADGAVAQLPAAYVAAHVTLAYASTVHAAQGRTVDTAHAVLGEWASRAAAYVALTRGRESNIAYLTTSRAPDSHDVERLAETVVGRMAAILDRAGDDRSAEWERRAGHAEGRSLAWVAGIWDQTSIEAAQARYTDILTRLLPHDVAERVVGEPGYPRLLRAVREAELAGHHPDALLAEAATTGVGLQVGESGSVADVLRWRVRFHARDRVPEQQIDPADWTTWAPPTGGPVGQFLHDLAVLATDRQAEIGRAAADSQPAWATHHLGAVPDEPAARAQWERAAGVVGAYRELVALDDTSVSLGPAPSREQVLHRALWQHAATALGTSADDRDLTAAPDTVLRDRVAAWERVLAWAPLYVAEELRAVHLAADEYRRDAILTAAERAAAAPATQAPDLQPGQAVVAATARAADHAAALAHDLERAYTDRATWTAATADIYQRARLAAEELDRRGQLAAPTTTPPAPPLDPAARDRDRQAAEPVLTAQPVTRRWRSLSSAVTRTGSTTEDIARIQQQTRDVLAAARSDARDAARERDAAALVGRWRDRYRTAFGLDESGHDRPGSIEGATGADSGTELDHSIAGDDIALDLDH
ncbi:MAG: hypothetical protein JWO98_4437, partial [Frankiales bacterium]|nr:hypothetical protein [Frankiales bacterium]